MYNCVPSFNPWLVSQIFTKCHHILYEMVSSLSIKNSHSCKIMFARFCLLCFTCKNIIMNKRGNDLREFFLTHIFVLIKLHDSHFLLNVWLYYLVLIFFFIQRLISSIIHSIYLRWKWRSFDVMYRHFPKVIYLPTSNDTLYSITWKYISSCEDRMTQEKKTYITCLFGANILEIHNYVHVLMISHGI